MNKLNISNVVLSMSVGLMGLSGQSFSNEQHDIGTVVSGSYMSKVNSDYEHKEYLLDEINIHINELVGNSGLSYKKSEKNNQSEMKELIGGWSLSHNNSGLSYTDKMMINEVVYHNGEYGAVGTLSTQQYGAGYLIVCLGQPQELVGFLGTDIACVSEVSGGYVMYSFKYSGNKITKGLYAFGRTIEDVAEDLVFNKRPLTGHRKGKVTNKILNTVSGLWYDPALSGLGFNFIDSEVGLTGYYYGYDHNGSALWLNATNSIKENIEVGKTYTLNMNQPTPGNGANFNTRPTSAASGTETWGILEVIFKSCSDGTAVLTGDDGVQSFSLVKLASNKGGSCN